MREEDIPGIVYLVNEECDYRNFFTDQAPLTEERARRWLASDSYIHWVVENQRSLIGFCFFNPGRNAYLGMVGVARAFRRRGIASELVRRALEFLRRRGCIRVTAEVREDNIPSRILLTRHGFRPEGFFENSFYDGCNEIRYVRFFR